MTTAQPLWQSVRDDLARRLADGDFDTRFPTDRELMETYEVSRHTAREAVRDLQRSTNIRRHPGRGSYVDHGAFVQPLGAVYSLFENIEKTGATQRSNVLSQTIVTDTVAAAALDVAPNVELFFLERVRLADDAPFAHDRVWLRLPRVQPLVDIDFSHTALYHEIQRHCGLVPESGRETYRPVMPDDRIAGWLDVDVGRPIMEIERRTFTDQTPLEWRITSVRSDRYALCAEWNTTTGDRAARIVGR